MTKQHRNTHAFSISGRRIEPRGERGAVEKLPGTRYAQDLTEKELRWRMCSAGPGYCGECDSPCAYGKEYIRRKGAAS